MEDFREPEGSRNLCKELRYQEAAERLSELQEEVIFYFSILSRAFYLD